MAVVTLWRVAMLAFDRTDLFVDEAQYWLWGQTIEFGYYSKPPLIGWVIRAFTELAGSDAAFFVRLPGALFHGATALILGCIAARAFGPRAGWVAAAVYVTLPFVSVGSFLISTDTIMFPFLAGAFLCWLRAIEDPRPVWPAALFGALLGCAFMAKYAAVYYLIGAGIAAIALPQARLRGAQIASALALFLLAISPNLLWNIANDFSTAQHTLDNADWVRDPGARAGLNLSGLAEFLGAQLIVFGPVMFVGLLWCAVRWPAEARVYLLFALPVLLIVSAQAILSQAYANWAVSAYLAATVALIPWLLAKPWLLAASLVINGAFALAVPLLAAFPEAIRAGGAPVMARYLGREDMSSALRAEANAIGASAIVSPNRDLLADLVYRAKVDAWNLSVFSTPPQGRPRHHYEQRHAIAKIEGHVLYAAPKDASPGCDAERLGQVAPESGSYAKHPVTLWKVRGDCWFKR